MSQRKKDQRFLLDVDPLVPALLLNLRHFKHTELPVAQMSAFALIIQDYNTLAAR